MRRVTSTLNRIRIQPALIAPLRPIHSSSRSTSSKTAQKQSGEQGSSEQGKQSANAQQTQQGQRQGQGQGKQGQDQGQLQTQSQDQGMLQAQTPFGGDSMLDHPFRGDLQSLGNLDKIRTDFDRAFDQLARGFGMNLPGASPFPSSFDDPFRSMDRMLSPFGSTVSDALSPSFAAVLPSLDVTELEDKYIVHMPFAGVGKEDIKVEVVDDNTIRVHGERKEPPHGKGRRRRAYYGKFERTFKMPENVDAEKVQARMESGMLAIEIPKHKEQDTSKRRQVEVQTGSSPSSPSSSSSTSSGTDSSSPAANATAEQQQSASGFSG